MSSSALALPQYKPILCGEECYCAICGIPFGTFLYKTRRQIHKQEPPVLLNGVEIGYDWKILGGFSKLAWVKLIYFIGYIPDIDETIISGSARLTAPGVIELYPDDKRNEDVPSEFEYECYKVSDDRVTVHPFHWSCFEIFARVLHPKADDPTRLVDVCDLDSTFASLSNCLTGLELYTGADSRQGKP
ncbi:uncharacterized protein F4807DRAFT_440421 [Annulohypoxylon truncatum]|uniref:uncharacterized protein n=1 Tax=Annulohypoxylon truncatum TaxID=327061 RepID=UPI00200746B7|nr:uncharacterized protein F4807DRAFT_440421 [Annulohypoxylon truncatum]KAI1206237.1 hypothetical protein F4807DRAFT_440421 [Annulohypoxylon truncatum]